MGGLASSCRRPVPVAARARGRGGRVRAARHGGGTVSSPFSAWPSRWLWPCGAGVPRRRGAVGGHLRSARWSTRAGTGTGSGCGSPLVDQFGTTYSKIASTTVIRFDSHRCVLRGCPSRSRIRSIASGSSRSGRRSCWTSSRWDVLALHCPYARRPHSHSGERNGSNRRRSKTGSSGLRPLARRCLGGPGAPRRRDDSAVVTARASGRF